MMPVSKNMLQGPLEGGQYPLLDSSWQIVQIAETSEPGVFRLWVLVGSSLHAVQVTVPRVFYVNELRARASDSSQYWCKSSRQLPRARHLYQYTMPEDVYQEQREKLMSDLSGPELEGIYETQLSLELRAVIQLGCICTVDKYEARRLKRIGQNIYSTSLNHLQFKKVSKLQPYLQKKDGVSPFKHILLYQFHHSTEAGLWALIFIDDKGCIYTMKDNSYKEIRLGEFNNDPAARKLTCEVKTKHDIRQIYEDIESSLSLYKTKCSEPTVVVVVARLSIAELVERIPGLSEFPLVPLYWVQTGLEFIYGESLMRGQCVIQHAFASFEKYMDEIIEQCRYCHIPLGNYNAAVAEPYGDSKIYYMNKYQARSAADVMFARRLTRGGAVLRWRHTDHYRLTAATNKYSARGVYRGVCAELYHDLIVNALLRAPTLSQMENVTSAGARDTSVQCAQGTTGLSLYESRQCGGVLQTLRAMVQSWHRDVTQDNNRVANGQLSKFYRWVESPSSALGCCSTLEAVRALASRLLAALVTSLARLGCTVVFADYSTIILATEKHDRQDAASYVEAVWRALKCQELFRDMRFQYKRRWAGLLWWDEDNYAEELITVPENSYKQFPVHISEKVHVIVMRSNPDYPYPEWRMGHLLPFVVRDMFWKVMENYTDTFRREILPRELVTIFNEEISKNLYKQTEKIMSIMPTFSETTIDDVMGLKMAKCLGATPALLFVNAVCDFLAEDSWIQNEVVNLRRSLLQLTGFEEWSLAAQYRDPGHNFQLPDYICHNCNETCPQLPFVFPFRAHIFLCHDIDRNGCHEPRDVKQVEWQLVEAVNEQVVAYTVQDLVCDRCHQASRDRLSASCRCSGQLSTPLPLHKLAHQLRSIREMADHYKMTLLQEILHFHISNMFTSDDYFSVI